MYIRFIKSHVLNNKKRVVGSIASVISSLGKSLISKKIAEEYTGKIPPPKQDVKFFEPKHTKHTHTQWQQQE